MTIRQSCWENISRTSIGFTIIFVFTTTCANATWDEEFEQARHPKVVSSKAVGEIHSQAEKGVASYQYELGNLFDIGIGEEQNYAEAVKWYRRAAEQGNADAQYHLGDMLDGGKGIEKNRIEAVKWFRAAAEQGHKNAQTILAFRLEQMSPPDYKEAVKWFHISVKRNKDSNTQNELALLYREGRGVPQNFKEAVRLYRLSAELGDPIAFHELAELYANGQGVIQNFVLAYMWANLATAESSNNPNYQPFSVFRDAIAAKLTTAQLANAQELASKCTVNKFKGC